MAAVSRADANWEGDLIHGGGKVRPASGAFAELPVTWQTRAERSEGATSPEELLAAAHAACFSMALSNILAEAGHPPEEIRTSARVQLRPVDGAPTIARIDLEVEERLIGGRAIDELGVPLPEATLSACRGSDAVLLGAVGGPRWDHLSGDLRCEAGLLGLRAGLGVFANVRPVRVHPRLADRTPLRPEVVRGVDLVVVRELTGGGYFGKPKGRDGRNAVDTISYSRDEIERVARVAFALAAERRSRLTSVDKANVLASYAFFREVASEVAARTVMSNVPRSSSDSTSTNVSRKS